MQSEHMTLHRSSWLAHLKVICTPRVVRKALLTAGLIGSLLVLLNQGDMLFSGQVTGRVLFKSLLTPIIPFCVTMLGALLNSGMPARPIDLRPGWAAIRRSVIIAVLVGGTIIALNQGDVLLAGAITPLVLFKVLVTPCVPFCVSLYGAYLVYQSTLTTSQESPRT